MCKVNYYNVQIYEIVICAQWPNGRQMGGLDLYDDATPQDCEQRYIVDALTEKAVKSKFVRIFIYNAIVFFV